MTKKRVAVLMGGWSAEREVSLDSGRPIAKSLAQQGYDVIEVDVTRDIEALIKALTPRPDVVLNALHGRGGEDGIIQGVLEMMELPYTHSGVTASAVAMDKVLSRRLFETASLKTPDWKLMTISSLKALEAKNEVPFKDGYVVKPTNEGSSVGVFIVKKGEKIPPLPDFYQQDQIVLVERYLPGREIQVGVMGDKALGAIEIRPKEGFYDYEAKYTDGKTDHLMPAPIPEKTYKKALEIALKAHQIVGCRGISRSDLIYQEQEDTFYLLEVNTHPGMTPLSLFPEIANYAGISFPQLLSWMIENAQCDQ